MKRANEPRKTIVSTVRDSKPIIQELKTTIRQTEFLYTDWHELSI